MNFILIIIIIFFTFSIVFIILVFICKLIKYNRLQVQELNMIIATDTYTPKILK